YLADKMIPPKAKPATAYVTIEPKELEKFAGSYPLPQIDQLLRTVEEQGKLWVLGNAQERLELHPLGLGHFYLQELNADITFSPTAGNGMSVRITQPGVVSEGDRLAPSAVAVAADFLPYAGTYWSEELETQYTFFVRNGALFGLQSHHSEFALVPTIKDQFSSGEWYAPQIKFVRDSAGAITGVTMGGGRVSAVKFARKPH
ncbi:MAG TPA: hypothetical protein VGD54_19095, partial [Steroidobacteraceae bacterium]